MPTIEDIDDTGFDEGTVAQLDDITNESIIERIAALKDIVHPAYRDGISTSVSNATNMIKKTISFGSQTAYVLVSSVIFLVTPIIISAMDEQGNGIGFQDMKSQQEANEILAPGVEFA